jgi:hypothetical protein
MYKDKRTNTDYFGLIHIRDWHNLSSRIKNKLRLLNNYKSLTTIFKLFTKFVWIVAFL